MAKEIKWIYSINFKIKDDKRDIIITDKECRIRKSKNGNRNDKWYKYACNKCGYDKGWIEEGNLKSGNGCACCSRAIIEKGINDISTTHPNLIEYFVDIEDTYKYSHGMRKKVLIKCPDCGFEKEMNINDLTSRGLGCPRCGDGISYPEKFMFNLLTDLGIDFNKEYSPKWANQKKYDFYFNLNNNKYLIEMDGLQHKIDSSWSTKENQINNDKLKDKMAKLNKYELIRIDCNKSNVECVKTSICESLISTIFDLSEINWNNIDYRSTKSLVKQVCDKWNESDGIITTTELGVIFKVHGNTIRAYLKKGNELNLCLYNPKEELIKNGKNNGKKQSKRVVCIENEQEFESTTELELKSIEIFGIQLNHRCIGQVCLGKQKHHKHLTFKYL